MTSKQKAWTVELSQPSNVVHFVGGDDDYVQDFIYHRVSINFNIFHIFPALHMDGFNWVNVIT